MPDRFKEGDKLIDPRAKEPFPTTLNSRDAAIANAVAALVEGEINAAAELHREFRMTPDGQWVSRMASAWVFDDDANEGRSIVENDAIQAEHAATNQQEAGA